MLFKDSNFVNIFSLEFWTGGEGGIRTPGRFNPSTVFKTAAFDRSATSPEELVKYSIDIPDVLKQ